MNFKYLITALLVFLSSTSKAGYDITPATMQAFDKIFNDVNSPNQPAVAVALLKNEKIIYQKSFGSVNLEYKVAATLDTKFQVDTLAWEFIAYATLMLEEQGKIRLNDDIRKYLPELPEYEGKITINHLLASTDGIYGYKVLKSLAGWDSKELGQHQSVVELIKRQKSLNFRPGTMFSAGGNTRLILLAKIVEVVSGQTFDEFCKINIFEPLGMSNTLFVYDSGMLLENTAVPYRNVGAGLYKTDYGSGVAGPVNLYTSIRDLSAWRSTILSRAAGMKSPASKLGLPIRLDSGEIIKDMSSISIYGQQHAGKERGIPKIYQLGSFGGYASSIFRFPDQDITVMVLSSGLAYNGSYGMRLASILLSKNFTEAETIDYSKIKSVQLSPEQLQKFEGNYWSAERAIPAKTYVKNNILYYSRLEGTERALIPLSESVFQMKIDGDDKYYIKFVDGERGKNMHFSMEDSDPIIFEPHTSASYTKTELAKFAGTFHCEELSSSFTLSENNGILTANNIRVGTVNLKPVKSDVFYGNKSFMGGIRFTRDRDNEIVGFKVMVDEVRNLEFKKIRVP
jgi:CubicO group peptidase (beta-lactamase class C family)